MMISIIVPVYKVEPYLHQCIDSIIHQTYRDLEILLIDDGSTDKCSEICNEYARFDPRIRVFHTQNRGLSAARNFGLQRAKGEYIGFVDSDDWIEPDMYEFLLRQIEVGDADISTCELWYEYPNCQKIGTKIQTIIYSGIEAIRALIHCSFYPSMWNKLFKKSLWSSVHFPDGHNFEDVSTLYKVILKAHRVSCSATPLYHYRMRKSSISHTCSMSDRIDRWMAYHSRYVSLSVLPGISTDKDCLTILKDVLAQIAVDIWCSVVKTPKTQRNYEKLREVSSFVRNNYPFFGHRDWSLSLRIGIFFSRYVNGFSFAFLSMLMTYSRLYRKIRHLGRTSHSDQNACPLFP